MKIKVNSNNNSLEKALQDYKVERERTKEIALNTLDNAIEALKQHDTYNLLVEKLKALERQIQGNKEIL